MKQEQEWIVGFTKPRRVACAFSADGSEALQEERERGCCRGYVDGGQNGL